MLVLRREPPVAYLTLARPEVHNAFNAELIAELHRDIDLVANDSTIRVVVLGGEGKSFSGGADVNWMRASLDLSRADNVEDSRRLSRMLRAIDTLPKIVIGRVQGAALGGGAGLAAVCDIVVATDSATFGFTETRLGILPAVISPFVLAKIGLSHARALALPGVRFDAEHARRIGFVHYVVPAEELDTRVAAIVADCLHAAPSAVAATKALFRAVWETPHDATLDLTAETLATQRVSPEGQEGLRAFLEKREAGWRR
jgi:methylglutaconyl-CoA hydratase